MIEKESKRIGPSVEKKKVEKHDEAINCVEKCISMESNVAYAAVKTCQDTKNVCNLIFNDRAILFVEIIDTSKHFFRTQHCLYRCKGLSRHKGINTFKF